VNLIDEVLSEKAVRVRCFTCAWLDTLDKKDRLEVNEAMGDSRAGHAALARAIRRRWPEAPSYSSFVRHRKGECDDTR